MKQKLYNPTNNRNKNNDFLDEDYEWENADKVIWDEDEYDSKWQLSPYKFPSYDEEHESTSVVNDRSPTFVNDGSPSNSLLNLLDDEPIPTFIDDYTYERSTIDDNTHERPTIDDDTPLKKRRIDYFEKGGKKRTHKKRTHKKRTHKKRTHKKRTYKRRTYKTQTNKKSRKFRK